MNLTITGAYILAFSVRKLDMTHTHQQNTYCKSSQRTTGKPPGLPGPHRRMDQVLQIRARHGEVPPRGMSKSAAPHHHHLPHLDFDLEGSLT